MDAKNYLLIIITILLLTDLAILLNIPFLRQILGFLFLTILPGLLILQILKLNKIGLTEKFVLSIGVSISFLMFFGLLINNFSLGIGYKSPLSTVSLLIWFNLAFITLAIVGYKINKTPIFSLPNVNLSTTEKGFLIVPVFFPALCIFGMHIMNTTDNNVILMFLYLLIPAYIIFVCFFNQKLPKRLYPVVIFSISISLLLMDLLRFPHIHGRDVHMEYYLFQTTLNNLHWGIVEYSVLDACLSISLLPAIYQSILNVNAQEYLFKGVYVSICSVGPLAVYILAKKYVDELYAFLASFFFISQSAFLTAVRNPRTDIAIFFAALALMVFFNDKIDPVKRRILFIVFILSVVVSHYSSAYLFFFLILFSWFGVEIFSKRYAVKKIITLTIAVLFFAFIFFWYSQVTEEPFNASVGYIENTFLNLNRFFIAESRDPSYGQLVGHGLEYGIISKINFFITWGSFSLIGIGVLTVIRRYKEMIVTSNVKLEKHDFLKTKFEIEHLTMALVCVGILALTVALPYVSTGYGIGRLYSLVVIILSLYFVMGGVTLSHFLFKERTCAKKAYGNIFSRGFCEAKKLFGKASSIKEKSDGKNMKQNRNGLQVRAYLIVLLILIPYFLMVTGVTHQIAGMHPSIILNSEGRAYEREYLHDQESCSAKWLNDYVKKNDGIYTTDKFVGLKLMSQAGIPQSSVDSGSFLDHKKIEGYIYLSYNNVVNDKFGGVSNRSDYADMFVGKNEIYDSGGSEIWK